MDMQLILLCLLSACCFAIALVLTKFGLRVLPPLSGAAISVPSTALLFLLISPLTIDTVAFDAHGAVIFAVAGLFFPIAVTLLTFSGNRHLGPAVTGALGNMSPLFAVLIAIAVLGEAPSALQAAGLGVVTFGVVLIVLGRGKGVRLDVARFPLWALALPIAAALVRGVVQPMVKLGLASWPDPFAAVTIGYLVSAIVALVARASAGGGFGRVPVSAALFVAVGAFNGMAVLTLYAALARGSVTLVAPMVAAYPLITLALESLLPDRPRLGVTIVTGIALTVGGVALLLAG